MAYMPRSMDNEQAVVPQNFDRPRAKVPLRRMRLGALLLLAYLVFLALGGCGSGDDGAAAMPYSDPSLAGPYPAGFTTIVLPEVAGLKNVPVEVWYPAAEVRASFDAYQIGRLRLTGAAWRDVAPAQDAPLLLVAFSHGLGGVRQQNYSMAERLASFGYVVVSADHPGTTVTDLVASFGDLTLPLVRRPATLRAAVDAVLAGAVPGLVPQPDRYAVVGHSLGAITAMVAAGGEISDARYTAACAGPTPPVACGLVGPIAFTEDLRSLLVPPDPRIVATVLQAPAGAFAFVPGTLESVPNALVLGGRFDGQFADGVVPVFEALGPGSEFLAFDSAGHNFPTNMCDIPVVQNLMPDCGGVDAGFRDPQQLLYISIRHVVAWLGIHLGGQPAFRDDLGPEEGVTWGVK